MVFEITTNPIRGVEAQQGTGHYGIFDHGAHIYSWQPDGQAPVLFLSRQAVFDDVTPLRGGVPVIFPWFGGGTAGDLAPSHGFVRTSTWHLSDTKDTLDRDGRLLVEYSIDNAMTGKQENFPHPYRAYLRAKFTPEYLGITLEVENTGDEAITFDNALHTYLAVGDVRRVTISGLDGASYADKVAGDTRVQDGDVTFTGPTDRVYSSMGDVVLHDPVLGRDLKIGKSGSTKTVIWSPWEDDAKSIPDLADDEWVGMVCVEAANALDEPVTLQPGQRHLLKQRITLL